MLSAALEKFVNAAAARMRNDYPEEVAHLSDFALKDFIVSDVRASGSQLAGELVEIHQTTELVKTLRKLVELH